MTSKDTRAQTNTRDSIIMQNSTQTMYSRDVICDVELSLRLSEMQAEIFETIQSCSIYFELFARNFILTMTDDDNYDIPQQYCALHSQLLNS